MYSTCTQQSCFVIDFHTCRSAADRQTDSTMDFSPVFTFICKSLRKQKVALFACTMTSTRAQGKHQN
jgi:hypothetical protein